MYPGVFPGSLAAKETVALHGVQQSLHASQAEEGGSLQINPSLPGV